MRKKSIILLIIMLLIGFASISATIILNGIVGIKTNTDNYIDGIVFDRKSLKSSKGITAEVSESGRTLSFTTQTMTSAGETSTVYFKIKNYSQYNATLGTPAISCYFVDSHNVDEKAVSTGTTHEYMELIPGHELDGDIINAGGGLSEESNVTVRQTKSYTGSDPQEIKFQCEINASGTDSITPSIEKIIKMPEGYYLTNDENNNGTADIGDEIMVGTESFYVISQTDKKINALAKYNLNVGDNKNPDVTEGIQHETVRGYVSSGTTYGTTAFSNQQGWSNVENSINIKKYAGPVKNALYGTNGYENYIKEKIPGANPSVRLITATEIEDLINNGNTLSSGSIQPKADAKGYPWIYYTSYWTQSANSDGVGNVWRVSSDGGFYAHYCATDNSVGIRPVITIHKAIKSTVTFNTNGGNAIDTSIEVTSGKVYGELPIPIKEDYEFLGWYTSDFEKVDSTTLVKSQENHTLTALWGPIYKLIVDNNKNGEVDIGDEITVGTESFYVISITDTELNALAKYNLNVGSNKNPDETKGIQLSGGNYTVKFSNQSGWTYDNNATINLRNSSNADGPVKDALYGENGYENYIKQIIPIANVSVRLITKAEIEDLINNGNTLSSGSIQLRADAKEYSWLYSTAYWTQSANSGGVGNVWHVNSSGGFYAHFCTTDDSVGIRPVVTIPLE